MMFIDKGVHFEIPFEDKKRAMEFYKKLFGWKLNDMPEMNYVIVHTGEVDKKQMLKEKGTINGGMMQKREEPGTVIVMSVNSIDKHVKKAESMGAKVAMPKIKVGDMGYNARIIDTEGNLIGLWENIPQKKK